MALGRLHANKAFDVLIRALAKVPRARLWIAGDGPEHAALAELAETLGIATRVRWLGWRDDPAPLYAAADIVAVPSRHEPLGNVVIEAWANERPVVAAASQGPAQLIEDGQTGLLAPVDDVEGLAQALQIAIDGGSATRSLARDGRAAYLADYTEDAVVSKYLDFFRALIA